MKFILARPDFRQLRKTPLTLSGVVLAMTLKVAPARAHAFGARYDLPLPLDFYLAGAGAAVALSFVIMALVFRGPSTRTGPPRIELARFGVMRALFHPVVTGALQALSVGLFILVLAAGFFGTQDTVGNFGPTFVWVIWWVGMAYISALLGNFWQAVNPWSVLFAWFETVMRRAVPRRRIGPYLTYPAWLGVWPGIVLFAIFAWLELISTAAEIPATLATLILIYSVITWTGMVLFGRDSWLAGGEAFSLAFGVLARFAPFRKSSAVNKDGQPGGWYARPYAAGLIVDKPCHPSMTVFVLLLLSTVTFDGFKETPVWFGLTQWFVSVPIVHPLILKLHEFGLDFLVVLKTAALFLFPFLFFAVYLGICWIAKDVSDSKRPVRDIAGLFVLSLVPIAIAYHLAHYLSYLLLAGQYIIPLASDPLGRGWDIFGTADYAVDIGIVGAKFVWYTAVAAIVVGHVFAVGVAHFVAVNVLETAKIALRSQYPFLFLMVVYTMVSLWILSQPVIENPDINYRGEPSDTVHLAPYAFHEYCLDMVAAEQIEYEFQSDGPINFNIHYHEGLTIRRRARAIGVNDGADNFTAPSDRTYCLMWANESVVDISLDYRTARP